MKVLIVIAALATVFTAQAQKLKMRHHKGLSYTLGLEQLEYRKRVVIIDGGATKNQLVQPYMCRDTAQFNFSPRVKPYSKHGQNITSIVSHKMNYREYCISMFSVNLKRKMEFEAALMRVVKMSRVSIVNLSLEHFRFDGMKYHAIRYLIMNRGVRFNVAAGNSSKNLDHRCDNYFACYGRLLKAESTDSYVYRESVRNPRRYFKVIGAKAGYSNRGKVVDMYLYGGLMGNPPMRGTSMATALYTNMMIRK